ncbi:MAG: UvrD-helicase domain-containing protein [Bacteroidaceae bacterium]|nr:UvrD-helicase domain-containing protein [Bacteroidaceae bacterium]
MNSTLTIYKASAGSGKTFTLTVEYIYLMVRPQAEEEYKYTLAVTFTNKATAEMKDRILQHLYGIWHALPSSEGYAGRIMEKLRRDGCGMTIEQMRQRCGNALTMILHDYSRFRVETIDSFFQNVLRTLARELGQSSGLQVDLDDKDVLELAVDRMIDSLDLDDALRKIVVQYVTDELDENGKWNIQSGIKDFARCIFQEDFMQRTTAERLATSDYKKVRDFRNRMKELMDKAAETISERTTTMFEYAKNVCTPDMVGSKSIPPLTYLQNILDGKDSANRNVAKGTTFNKFLSDGTTLLLSKNRKDVSACAMFQALSDKFEAFLDEETSIRRQYNTAKLARHFTNQLQLLARIDEIVRDIYEERETFPLSRTPTLLSSLIDGQDSPFVFEKIGTVLKNVMIDEFQDTSRLQWNNFRVLLFENQAVGGTDLIVGDIKQSIYRWRGGEWSLLSNLADNMVKWCPRTETLDTNYRSEHRIIDFNNRFFPEAAALLDTITGEPRFAIGGSDGIYGDVVQKIPASKTDATKGFCSVTLHIHGTKSNGYPQHTSEEEQELVLEDMLRRVCALHDAGLPLDKMAILLRYNRSASVILDYFQRHAPAEIRIASDEAFLLGNSSIVIIIISAMHTLLDDYETQPLAYYRLLMHYLREIKNMDVSADRIMRSNALEMIPPFLREERNRLRQMPLYELVEELYRKLHLDRLSGQEAYHYAFLDAVQLYLKDNSNDLHSFLTMWDTVLCRQAIPSGKQDGIRILTIHKSKGLEFHTVLLPFCDWAMESDKSETLWCEAEDGHDEFNTLGKMPISKTSGMSQSYYSGRYEEERQQNRVDELNALYVALTRATCNMYIWAWCKDKPFAENTTVGNLLARCLNPQACYQDDGIWSWQDGEPVTEVKTQKASDNRMQPDYTPVCAKMVSYKARLNFRQSNEAKEMLDADGNRTLGTLYHNVLSEIGNTGMVEIVLRRNRMQGRLTDEQCDELRGYLHQIDDNPLVASWFDTDNRIFSECDILDPTAARCHSRTQRPDRIIMKDNHITVIDYKFGDKHDSYKKQVKNYMRLLQAMYPDHIINGYLWYVRNETIEKVR